MRRTFAYLVAALLILLGMADVSAQNTKSQEQRRERLENEIKILDKQLRDNAKKSSAALSDLSLIRKKISNRKELVEEGNRTVAALNARISAKRLEVERIQARLDTLTLYYSRLVHSAYKNRDSRIWYMYILASDNVGQALRRYGYLKNISSEMNRQAAKIKETRARLDEETAALEELRKEVVAERNKNVAQMNQLQSDEKDSRQIVNQLNRDKKKYEKQIADKRRQVEALNKEIARIIAEATAATTAPSKGKKGTTAPSKPRTEIDYKLASEFEANKGKLPWPADGPVTEHFGQNYHPVFKNVKLPYNNGVTLAVSPNTAVKAVFGGIVKQIVVMPGYNHCVLVQHGSYFTFYCKLGSVAVKAGDKVKLGQVLGTVDTIGGETLFHFQIWSGRTPQNPETWLRP
ncbi:MAG: peptidoglycan DD-metalloendopeptidase family protein [Bacteroidales bacterium]|nr:peptidoglycan DD-metalloendopeptidase family protein [Bacteroidales bacterium]